MSGFQERARAELDELVVKLEALIGFIETSVVYQGLPEADQKLLQEQRGLMNGYASVLRARIKRFT